MELAVGRRKKAISQGLIGMKFGYSLGLVSEDPAIVGVEYADNDCLSGKAYLVGRKPGTTRVHYVNAFVFRTPQPPMNTAYLRSIQERSEGCFVVNTISENLP